MGSTGNRMPGAIPAVLVSLLVGGCGLVGIELFPEPVVHTAQFYNAAFFCDLDENGDLARSTRVILHNPQGGPVTIFHRAAGIGMEMNGETSWSKQVLEAGSSAKLDCDSLARMLTNDPSTSFKNEFDAGASIQGFLTIGIEAGSEIPMLDAAAQYDEPDGSLRLEPIAHSLVEVTSWPPITIAD